MTTGNENSIQRMQVGVGMENTYPANPIPPNADMVAINQDILRAQPESQFFQVNYLTPVSNQANVITNFVAAGNCLAIFAVGSQLQQVGTGTWRSAVLPAQHNVKFNVAFDPNPATFDQGIALPLNVRQYAEPVGPTYLETPAGSRIIQFTGVPFNRFSYRYNTLGVTLIPPIFWATIMFVSWYDPTAKVTIE